MATMKPLLKTAVLSSILGSSALLSAHAADLSAVPSGSYEVDPTHAYINFQYNHLGLSNPTLSFDDFTVDMELDNEDPTKSTINVSIDPASVLTGSEIWKEHLTSGDWFDVANHPEITFSSNSIELAGDGTYVVNAAMNHPMSGKPVIGFDATADLLRSSFGLDKFAPNVSDEVFLIISAEMLHAEK